MTLLNVRGVGANKFIVNDADFNILTLRYVLDLTVPELIITGEHISKGLIGGVFPMTGEGPFT